jgi:hypothetical protein
MTSARASPGAGGVRAGTISFEQDRSSDVPADDPDTQVTSTPSGSGAGNASDLLGVGHVEK